MSRSRSVSPPESSTAVATGSSESPVVAAQSAEGGQCEEQVLFESYLYKVPPLKKSLLMVKWSKRWFVLKKVIQTDLVSINLCYYKDINKKSSPRMINLSKITGIRPSSKIGSSDHIFAIETEERKYILRAQDHNTKNIWLAKLCELCGQEVVYHVTIPKQNPIPADYSEAIIRFGTPGHVTFATPSSNSTILSIPHADVRRLGLNNSYGFSILWFEICRNSKSDQFFFVLIPSSQDTARQILQELKVAIQTGGRPLIKEESGNLETSYIARSHYGCQEFPSDARYNILQTSLCQISSSPHSSPLPVFAGRFFPPIPLPTPSTEKKKDPLIPSHSQSEIQVSGNSSGVSLEEFGRRKTYSRYPQPSALNRKPTLDKFVRQGSTSSSFERQPSMSSTLERQSSVSSPFERQMSISSMDHSSRTMSLDRSSPPSSQRESDDDESTTERRCSSSSSSEVFDFPIIANGRSLKRKLSIQSSLSSQNSAQFSSSHSPPIMEEVVADSFTFEQTSDINSVPAVPPRSIISLAEVTPAH